MQSFMQTLNEYLSKNTKIISGSAVTTSVKDSNFILVESPATTAESGKTYYFFIRPTAAKSIEFELRSQTSSTWNKTLWELVRKSIRENGNSKFICFYYFKNDWSFIQDGWDDDELVDFTKSKLSKRFVFYKDMEWDDLVKFIK